MCKQCACRERDPFCQRDKSHHPDGILTNPISSKQLSYLLRLPRERPTTRRRRDDNKRKKSIKIYYKSFSLLDLFAVVRLLVGQLCP